MPLHQEKGERLAVWQLISLRECFYQHRHFQEVSFSPRCSFLGITLQTPAQLAASECFDLLGAACSNALMFGLIFCLCQIMGCFGVPELFVGNKISFSDSRCLRTNFCLSFISESRCPQFS